MYARLTWTMTSSHGCTKQLEKARMRGNERDQDQSTLTTETVQGTALSLQGIDDIERSNSLALGVLSVCDGITNDRLEEGLEYTTGLFVDHGRDTLHTTTTSETTDGGLGNTLDVVAKNLSVALCSSFAEALAAFSTSSHIDLDWKSCWLMVLMKFMGESGLLWMKWMLVDGVVG